MCNQDVDKDLPREAKLFVVKVLLDVAGLLVWDPNRGPAQDRSDVVLGLPSAFEEFFSIHSLEVKGALRPPICANSLT
jgi:hypothetical protein